MKWTNSEKYKLPKLTQQETENMNRPTSKEIESIIKPPPTQKSLGPDAFMGEFYHLKAYTNLYPTLVNTAEEGILPERFFSAAPCQQHCHVPGLLSLQARWPVSSPCSKGLPPLPP